MSDFSYKSYAGHPRFYSFRAMGSHQFSLEYSPRFWPEGCPAVLWMPIFGRNTRKIHLISHTFTGKREFWTASFQCLAKSLVQPCWYFPFSDCVFCHEKTLICVLLVSFHLDNYFKKFKRLKTTCNIKLRTLELQNLVPFFILICLMKL